MEQILARWGIRGPVTISPTALGSGRTWSIDSLAGRHYMLKAVDRTRADRERRVLLGLAAAGVPVAPPIAAEDGAWYVEDREGRPHCLYARLPGTAYTTYYDADGEAWAGRFGRALGLLHEGLRKCAEPEGPRDAGIIDQVNTWVMPRIRAATGIVDGDAAERVWRDVAPTLDALYGGLPQQLIHRDPHPGNMLFLGGQLTGWLDLEQVRRGPRLFDVCYCAGSILVEGFEEPDRARRWPGLFRSLVRGYDAFLPLTEGERQAAYGVFVMIELTFVGFYLELGLGETAQMAERLLHWMAAHREAFAL